jgi:hypothetical protein
MIVRQGLLVWLTALLLRPPILLDEPHLVVGAIREVLIATRR